MTKIIRALSKVQKEIDNVLKEKSKVGATFFEMDLTKKRVFNFERLKGKDLQGYNRVWNIVKKNYDKYTKFIRENENLGSILWLTYDTIIISDYELLEDKVAKLYSKERALHRLFDKWCDKEFSIFDK